MRVLTQRLAHRGVGRAAQLNGLGQVGSEFGFVALQPGRERGAGNFSGRFHG